MALTQWLPVSRRGAGEYTTPSFTIPDGVDSVHVHLDVLDNDFNTSAVSVTATIEVSQDGGQTWQFQMSVSWVGATPPPINRGGITGWYAAVSDLHHFVGMLVRVHFSTVGTFRWGLEGELI